MLRALKKSFTCTARKRRGSHSRQRSILLHMAECSKKGSDENLEMNDAIEEMKNPQKRHESRRSRHNSANSIIGRNNSMNDWQEIMAALKNADRSRNNSIEQQNRVKAETQPSVKAESQPVKAVTPDEEPAAIESPDGLSSNNVDSRLTPSATPMLQRQTSLATTNTEADFGGERFISEYNVRLEPVIKICIPCQHDHGQFHTPPPVARLANIGRESVDVGVNSNSAGALMMGSINMAGARVEVAVESPETGIAATMLTADSAAGDESFKRLAIEPPPPTPEVAKTVTPPQTPEMMLLLPDLQAICGDRCGTNGGSTSIASQASNEAAAYVEVGNIGEVSEVVEVVEGDLQSSEKNIDVRKDGQKTILEEEDEYEFLEPASASEFETSRMESHSQISMTSDKIHHVEVENMKQEEPGDSMPLPESPSIDNLKEASINNESEISGKESPVSEKKEVEIEKEMEEEVTFEKESTVMADEEQVTTIEMDDKQQEFEREASPTSPSLASFVDLYDKEPLHPTDDSKTTVNLMRDSAGSREESEKPQQEQSDVRAAPWLGTNKPTTSADRWKRMKQIVKEREEAIAQAPAVSADPEGESKTAEVDSELRNLMDNLKQGGTTSKILPSGEEDFIDIPINDELRYILSTLSTHEIMKQKNLLEPKPNIPQTSRLQTKSPTVKVNSKQQVPEKRVNTPRKENAMRQIGTAGAVNDGKQRNFSIQMELDASDAVVCSFLRPADRRVVAAAAKNNCTVTMSAADDRSVKTSRKFLCVVRGPTRDQVARCINFLKDTFPRSYIRYNR